MKLSFIKTLSFGLLATLALGLSACTSDDEPTPPPTPNPGGGTVSPAGEIARVTLTLSMGHLHGRKDFHFVPSSGKYEFRNIYDTQEFTFVKKGETWTLAEGAPYADFIAFQLFAWDPKVYSSIAPDYGAIIRLYDAEGKLLNDQYTSEALRSQYQFFSYPTEAKDFDGKPIAVNAADPTNLLRYVYCDTNVWNKSASKSPEDKDGKKLYTFLPDTEPIGIKGYYQFPETGRFLLNIELWYSPKGKLEGGKPSPFFAPNATVKSGKCLLHLTLLEEVEDPVVVGTAILGVELRPSAVLLGDGLLVLGQGDELDLELGELAIGFGDRAKALLQSRSHLDAFPQFARTGIELY